MAARSTWAFGQETAVHALRLIGSGLFDRHPQLAIILGHMGEGLPYRHVARRQPQRMDGRETQLPSETMYRGLFPIELLSHHIRQFRTQALINAILEIGADRILFSTDWPFENIDHAADWFDAAAISEADRAKIGRLNAQKLFKLH